AAARQYRAAARRRRAVHSDVAVARHPRLGAHLVAAGGDDGRAARDDAAERAAVWIHLSDREHAAAAAAVFVRDSRPVVYRDRARHHAEGHRTGRVVARDGGVDGDDGDPADRKRALVQGAAGVVVRRILYLEQAEVLHVVRDRATLAQVLIVPMVQLLILSNAATFQIRNSDTYL